MSPDSHTPVTGITGPPGAGKSTITDLIIGEFVNRGERVCVLCTDPSSAFTGGALLGDRIRMRSWYNHPGVYIRSLSSRGTLGGLNPLIIEISDIARAAGFNQVLIETVGVGQTELAISRIADTTVVVQVPEGGDDVQAMKAGLLEIADIFVVNKCDRPGADVFAKHLLHMASPHGRHLPVVKMTATEKKGIEGLVAEIDRHNGEISINRQQRISLTTERAWQIAVKKMMSKIDRKEIESKIAMAEPGKPINLYKLVDEIVGS